MLSKSSIFLRLLGSFYRQVGATDFNNKIDSVYSKMLLTRYKNTINSAIATSSLSSIYGAVHAGYIDISEINTPNREVIIRTIEGVSVSDVDYISFSFIDADKAFMVYQAGNALTVSQEAIDEMSTINTSGKIFILYGNTGYPSKVIDNFLTLNVDFDSEVLKEVTPLGIEMVSKYFLYKNDSPNMIYMLSNILLGAIFSTINETVVNIDDNIVYTDKNEYIVEPENGNIIVSIGDEINNGITMITEICSVYTSRRTSVNIQDIDLFMASNGISQENITYLLSLSSTVANKTVTIDIPPEFITNNPMILGVLSENFNTISTVTTILESAGQNEDEASVNINGGYLIEDSSIFSINVVGKWNFSISDGAIVDNGDTGLFLISDDSLLSSSDMLTSSGTFEDNQVASPTEETMLLITDLVESTEYIEEGLSGVYIDTNILSNSNDSNLIVPSASVANFEDNKNIETADASFYETASAESSDTKEILYSEIATHIINDFYGRFVFQIDNFSNEDDMSMSSMISDETIAIGDVSDEFMHNISSIIPTSEEHNIDIVLLEQAQAIERIYSESTLHENETVTIEIDSHDINVIRHSIFVTDISNITSDIEIDS